MSRNITKVAGIVAVGTLLVLGACSDNPPAAELRKAVQEQMDSPTGKAINGGEVVVEDIRNLKCGQERGRPGYVCSYDLTLVHKRNGLRGTSPAEARFVKSGSGWVVAAER
jgi:hypothetical protein